MLHKVYLNGLWQRVKAMETVLHNKGRIATIGGVAIAAVLAISLIAANFTTVPQVLATHQPADKIAASASVIEVARVQSGPGSIVEDEIPLIMSSTFKTSSPTDLYIEFNTECALLTDVTVKKSDTVNIPDSSAAAGMTIYVKLDGVVVPVTNDRNGDSVYNDPDDGKVVYCDRAVRVNTNILQEIWNICGDPEVNTCTEEELFLSIYQNTKSTHGFTWIALNVGSGTHTIQVYADADLNVSGSGTAQAVIGKRVLFVEPGKLANDVNI